MKLAHLGFSGSFSLSSAAELGWNHPSGAPPGCNVGGKKSLSVTSIDVDTATASFPKACPHISFSLPITFPFYRCSNWGS